MRGGAGLCNPTPMARRGSPMRMIVVGDGCPCCVIHCRRSRSSAGSSGGFTAPAVPPLRIGPYLAATSAFRSRLRPRAEMRDHLRRRHRAPAAAFRQRQAAASAQRGSRRHRRRRRRWCPPPWSDARQRACISASATTTLPCSLRVSAASADVLAHQRRRLLEAIGLVQGADLGLVGEEDVGLLAHEVAEGVRGGAARRRGRRG